jgi:catechol O-methyltransferase
MKTHGVFDFVFLDHNRNRYLPDLLELEKIGSIQKGTIVVGDNILFPGAPAYLQYFKESNQYDSILYHSHLEYSDSYDEILVSHRIS